MAFPHDELDNIHFFIFSSFFFLKCASRYCSLHVPQRLKARHCSQMAPSELTHDNFNCCGLTSWMSKISFVSFQSLLFRKCFPINSWTAAILGRLSQSLATPKKIEKQHETSRFTLPFFWGLPEILCNKFPPVGSPRCAVRQSVSAEAWLRVPRATPQPHRSKFRVPWLPLLGCATKMHGGSFQTSTLEMTGVSDIHVISRRCSDLCNLTLQHILQHRYLLASASVYEMKAC